MISFLEEKLTLAGLNSKEQADFITYWVPRLTQNEINFVRFEFNEECNRYAELEITPKPDHLVRFYMVWSPMDSATQLTLERSKFPLKSAKDLPFWNGEELKFRSKIDLQLNK